MTEPSGHRDLFDMTGRVALITGSTRGMGMAAAEELARHGAEVVIVGRNVGDTGAAAETINAAIGAERAHPVVADIGHRDTVLDLVARTQRDLGRIDVLMLHAGMNIWLGETTELEDRTLAKFLESSVMSAHWFCREVLPGMVERGWGRIVFTSSVIGSTLGSSDNGPYGITKAALVQMARNLACEYGRHGIRANAIAPALFDTRQAHSVLSDEDRLRRYIERCPAGRVGQASEFAGLALLLSSDAGGYINGQAINVDGGYSVLWDSYS
ncbi:SDR family NAD(P)-dependent oxidoreductase [Nocardia sp. alder85J]|uniref:SDR family NAD(P)-dependent oxidoreductase n=1 Tax=Nocardia sp. alder85J TaxID=2862949 RepID=UPI001CD2603C|nr:SDR family oxidoreductase [Nocardia sp. alder85J]MCX4095696.1 SDR family NAD(P)-dependent oxidoreductase [Nocardia sp. alder85J]